MKRFKFIIRGNEYETEIIKLEGLTATIEVNGTQYNVELQKDKKASELQSIRRQAVGGGIATGQQHTSNGGGIFAVKAPLPGHIMQVFVKEGDTIKKDEKLLIYEAMKMENLLKSEKEGTIKSVKVKPGDTVLQDDLLIEIEL